MEAPTKPTPIAPIVQEARRLDSRIHLRKSRLEEKLQIIERLEDLWAGVVRQLEQENPTVGYEL